MAKAKKIFLKVKEMGRGTWDLERVEKQEASEKIKSEKSNEIIFSLWFWIKS